jgi:hypothetical protein
LWAPLLAKLEVHFGKAMAAPEVIIHDIEEPMIWPQEVFFLDIVTVVATFPNAPHVG